MWKIEENGEVWELLTIPHLHLLFVNAFPTKDEARRVARLIPLTTTIRLLEVK